ncbi:methyltransferase domain-containing protein [Rhizophagus clarus]|uniref:Methyltransferase domain-containing protein n=1 Tax=Rhizophagus clarus TaxID=94130 RepID=A0A8H3KZ45_9GLOM|nr:methyltransferase domain-containing protein [Rhizophagus clarus]
MDQMKFDSVTRRGNPFNKVKTMYLPYENFEQNAEATSPSNWQLNRNEIPPGVNPHHLLPPPPQNYLPQRPIVSTFNNAHQINHPLYFRPPNQLHDKFKKNKRGFIRHNEVTNNQYAYTTDQNLKNNNYSASPRFNLHPGYQTWHAPNNNNNSHWPIANSTGCQHAPKQFDRQNRQMFPPGTQPYPIYHFSQQYSHHLVPNYPYPQQPNNCQYFASQRPPQHFYQHGTQSNDFHQVINPQSSTDNNNENVENVENITQAKKCKRNKKKKVVEHSKNSINIANDQIVPKASSEFIKQNDSESKKRIRPSDRSSIIPLSNDSLTKSFHTYENDGRKLFTKKKIVNKIEINLKERVNKDKINRLNNNSSKSYIADDENYEVFGIKKKIKLDAEIDSNSSVHDTTSTENIQILSQANTDVLSSSISNISAVIDDSYSNIIDPSKSIIFDDSLSQNENSNRRDSGVACDNMELDDMVIKEKDINDPPITISNPVLENSYYNSNPIINNSKTINDLVVPNLVSSDANAKIVMESKLTKYINNNLLNSNNEFQENLFVSSNPTPEISETLNLSSIIRKESTNIISNSENEIQQEKDEKISNQSKLSYESDTTVVNEHEGLITSSNATNDDSNIPIDKKVGDDLKENLPNNYLQESVFEVVNNSNDIQSPEIIVDDLPEFEDPDIKLVSNENQGIDSTAELTNSFLKKEETIQVARDDKKSPNLPSNNSTKTEKDKDKFSGTIFTRRSIRDLAFAKFEGYSMNQRVKVLNVDSIWYPGTIIAMDKTKVRVRYDGWDAKYDEWVPNDSRRLRVMSDEEILEIQQNSSQNNHEMIKQCLIFDDKIEKRESISTTTDTEDHQTGFSKRTKKRSTKKQTSSGDNTKKVRDSPKIQLSQIKKSIDRKQKKNNSRPKSPTNVDKKKCNSCENIFDKLERVGALELCTKCVPLFAPQLTRVKAFAHDFTLDQKVQVLNIDKIWYPARIVSVEKSRVQVHYDGWGKKFDEWISVESRRLKALSEDEVNEVQKENNLSDDAGNRQNKFNKDQNQTKASTSEDSPKFIISADDKLKKDSVRSRDVDKERQLNTYKLKEILGSDSESLSSAPDSDSDSLSSCPESISSSSSSLSASESNYNSLSGSSDDEFEVKMPKIKRTIRHNKRAPIRKRILQSSKEKICESCKITHLNVQRIGSLDLCTYCRSLFGDDATFRFKRGGQYGFELHKRVKVLSRDGEWYPATMVDVEDGRIRVHFDGWSDYFDEWIPAGSQRMRDMTLEEIIEAQKALEQLDKETLEQREMIYKPQKRRRNNLKRTVQSSSSVSPINEVSKSIDSTNNKADVDSSLPDQQSDHSTDSVISFDWNEYYFGRDTRRSLRNDKLLSNSDVLAKLKSRFKSGNQIEVRDRLKEWVPATIIETKGCRVLIHYDDVPAFYDEWIDISSERLREKCTKNETKEVAKNIRSATASLESKKDLKKKKDKTENDDYRLEFVVNGALNGRLITADDKWCIYCNQCNVVIKQFRYYCTYCESPSEGNDYKSFELCVWCFAHQFPNYHEHPRCSFAVQSVIDDEAIKMSSKGEVVKTFERDVFDTTYKEPEFDLTSNEVPLDTDMGYLYLQAWNLRKICGFCNDDDPNQLGGFIAPYPFVSNTYTRHGEKQKTFWSHYACAKYSPEVFFTKSNEWYNVTLAWKRGRSMKCGKCKERGATIGCFEPKCAKSYHLSCTDKPLSHFEMGVIFYCPSHEARYLQKELYNEVYRCDVCSCELQEDKWMTCRPCESNFFSSFDLCLQCFEVKFPEHEHNKDEFEETSVKKIKDAQITKQATLAVANQKARNAGIRKKSKNSLQNKGGRIQCSYCWAEESSRWRKGYNGVLMCEDCFELVLVNNNSGEPQEKDKLLVTSEDYSYQPYLTRNFCSDKKFDDFESQAMYLDSYEPVENQLFSLSFDSSYFDIPGRAPRWATHSGTDYHGTWLPQTVRRALLRFTKKNGRVLSNFLGRGTDAIESFLLGRRLVGVDINPAAVALSQRNCSFAIPPNRDITAEHRPIILQADSRNFSGPMFEDESFDHILSHPPYKNCVEYSTHIDGDLSRFANSKEFATEMSKVIDESWRLLKPGRRVTLGIGDNREHCFYVPVSFNLFRQYIDQGFELEELVAKRQRYCQAFGLGTYLCVQYDFLMFTHEFIATFKKVDKAHNNRMLVTPDESTLSGTVIFSRNLREIPVLPIARKSVVMGTTWTFKPTPTHSFVQLCTSRMVERFGRDFANWEEIQIKFNNLEPNNIANDNSSDKLTKFEDQIDNEEDDMPEYERIRQKRIKENQKMLLSLGLKCDLGETSDDISHLEKILHTIKHLAKEAYERLPPSGFFVIGGQDVRTSDNKLWPLSMLFMEDVNNSVGEDKMPLKELVVTVPEGYAKDKKKITKKEDYIEEQCILDEDKIEHLSIVHACYLIFMKLR